MGAVWRGVVGGGREGEAEKEVRQQFQYAGGEGRETGGGLYQDVSSAGGEKWSDSGHILFKRDHRVS